MIPAEKVQHISHLPESELSFAKAGAESIAVQYTGDLDLEHNQFHFDIVRKQLTRKLPLLTADVYSELVSLGRLGWAALAVGTGQAVLDYVKSYVNTRVAFGEPISNRQAVAFKVADIAIELEGARLVTLRAAARAEQGRSFAREAGLARKLTAEYGMRIGSDGVQLLGGHGFVKEHPVERWYRDLRAAAVMEGAVLV